MTIRNRKRFNLGRRRTLSILAAASTLSSLRTAWATSATPQAYTWEGTALGAKASLTLYDVNRGEGRQLVEQVGNELERLENIFSLYRMDSTISILNDKGYVDNPPLDLVRVMSAANAASEATRGAFDVTVQPLWNMYAGHFSSGDAKSTGPESDVVDAARELIGYEDVDIDSTAISFKKPGMSITLNGIAQGYITDRVADLLYAKGLRHVLIDLGEIRALDKHPSGRPWIIGLEDPANLGGITNKVDIDNQAVATSAGSSTHFDNKGAHHHIFDPRSGRSNNIYSSISVVGERASLADALSTGLYNLDPSQARDVLGQFPGYAAYVIYDDGRAETWSG